MSAAFGLPRVGVALFLLDDMDRTVLMRRRGSHGVGTYGLIGGGMEFGETIEEAACRECREEVGVFVDPADVALGPYTNDVFEREGKHFVTLFCSARITGGQVPVIMEPGKCDDLGFYARDAFPNDLFQPLKALLALGFPPPPFATFQVG